MLEGPRILRVCFIFFLFLFYILVFTIYCFSLQHILKFHSKYIKKYIEDKKARFYFSTFRSSSSVPNCHRKSGSFSWQHGNSQPSSPQFCIFAYVSKFYFLRIICYWFFKSIVKKIDSLYFQISNHFQSNRKKLISWKVYIDVQKKTRTIQWTIANIVIIINYCITIFIIFIIVNFHIIILIIINYCIILLIFLFYF